VCSCSFTWLSLFLSTFVSCLLFSLFSGCVHNVAYGIRALALAFNGNIICIVFRSALGAESLKGVPRKSKQGKAETPESQETVEVAAPAEKRSPELPRRSVGTSFLILVAVLHLAEIWDHTCNAAALPLGATLAFPRNRNFAQTSRQTHTPMLVEPPPSPPPPSPLLPPAPALYPPPLLLANMKSMFPSSPQCRSRRKGALETSIHVLTSELQLRGRVARDLRG
jgi:hypothetical protein